MSVYFKERPEWLRQAIESVFNQTVKPAEVVLVEDGTLTAELEAVVKEFEARHAELKVIRCKENHGLGKALNLGLKHCSHDLVARMDTDDISKPWRFEYQIKTFEEMPDLSVCGGWINEFCTSPEEIISQRCTPMTSAEIYDFGKQRNPMNHMTVMFRKSDVEYSGGYQDFPLFEDYFLWVRMLLAGYKFHTLQKPIVDVRTDTGMIARRGGLRYALVEMRLQVLFFGLRYITFGTMLRNICIRFTARVMPPSCRSWLYRHKLRKQQYGSPSVKPSRSA